MENPDGERDRALFGEIYPGLWRFAAAICDADQDPDDLVQEALVQAIESNREPNPTAHCRVFQNG